MESKDAEMCAYHGQLAICRPLLLRVLLMLIWYIHFFRFVCLLIIIANKYTLPNFELMK